MQSDVNQNWLLSRQEVNKLVYTDPSRTRYRRWSPTDEVGAYFTSLGHTEIRIFLSVIAQRRQPEADHGDPEVEILAKRAALRHALERTMRCRTRSRAT